jgi:transcriptional regulator with XRE-family HTH domain
VVEPFRNGPITAPNIPCAARGLLAWSQSDLASKSGVSRATVADFETGKRQPIGNNLAAISAALESAGIIFLSNGQSIDGGPGVSLKND